jgi:leucyl aminopeptidase
MPIAFSAATQVPANAEVLGVAVGSGNQVPPGQPVELDTGFLARSGFEGKVGQIQTLLADDGSSIVAVGIGDPAKVTADILRRAAGAFVRAAARASRVATTLVTAGGDMVSDERAAQAVAEGIVLGAYRFAEYKSNGQPNQVGTCTLVGPRPARLQAGAARGARVAQAVSLARDLVNQPAGAMTPRRLAEVATDAGRRAGLQVTVWDEATITDERLGGLLGVARGSDEPPRLIQLTYEPKARARGHLFLVGKGITFDSGGLSLKTADGMMTMKTDMSGAAAVLAAMSALPALRPPVRVTGILPVTENMPSGHAIKPGDVLRIRNGKTVEVLNTDAEGRLVLADGLSLAVEAGADAIVDLATLTGAVVIALGRKIAGLMGTSDNLMAQIQAASDRAGERVWPLPLPDDYRRDIDSEIADIKNLGAPGSAGTIAAGLFLKEFVGDVPWAHLDIAGTARSDADEHYLTKGGTGFGVRTLIELATTFEKPPR